MSSQDNTNANNPALLRKPTQYQFKLVLLVYDITLSNSFERAQSWINELKKYEENEILIVLAGNKLDLEEMRVVSKEEGSAFASENNLLFFETSAKNSINVSELFLCLAKKLVENRKPLPEQNTPQNRLNLSSGQTQNNDSCAC
ncbi:hypothetical protein BB560_005092 [Smittium megazygosporum]|uniref:Uncharacterized protein n=1 Tax=Smittium megazygosporum TaxID=133381 RepID=A0A2T9Z7F1_9FUNG|nr:hypothetical protein BB560_005092 [Smittium megazygosporum]